MFCFPLLCFSAGVFFFLQNECRGRSSLRELSIFVPRLDTAEARDLNLGALRGRRRENKRNSNLKGHGLAQGLFYFFTHGLHTEGFLYCHLLLFLYYFYSSSITEAHLQDTTVEERLCCERFYRQSVRLKNGNDSRCWEWSGWLWRWRVVLDEDSQRLGMSGSNKKKMRWPRLGKGCYFQFDFYFLTPNSIEWNTDVVSEPIPGTSAWVSGG